jgi:hypothetical protein
LNPLGAGAHRLQVGAGAGLGHRDRGHHLAAGHLGQPALALRFGAITQDVVRHDAAVHAVGKAAGHLQRQRLGDGDLMPEVAAAAAIGFGDAGAQQAGGTGLVPDLAVAAALLAPARVVRQAVALGKAGGGVGQLLQVVGQPRGLGMLTMLMVVLHRTPAPGR